MKNAKFTLILSHSNAESINSMYDWVNEELMPKIHVNVIAYEYYGYNPNDTCKPSEEEIYDDIESVYKYATEDLNI